MADLKKKFNNIITDLEENIKSKEDLDYIKSQVYNIALIFLEEVDKLTELSFDRLNVMIDREKELSKKVAKMEKMMSDLEKEVFVPSDCDFEIICPYCNTEFIEDFESGLEHEIRCPECGNLIELDWHENEEDECCMHECGGECGHGEHDSCKHGECKHHHEEEIDDDEDDDEIEGEDDM